MKKHDPYWNNVKFFLISFVVVGHFCEAFITSSRLLTLIWETIYIFHMPAFIMVSGIFLKRTIERTPFRIDRSVGYFFAFLFIFLTYNFECAFFFHWERNWHMFIAIGPHWYMLAMAIFICITHLLKDIKKD